MSLDNEKNECGCGCGCGENHNHEHEHEHGCGCGEKHSHEHEHGCGCDDHDHEHECGCGCGDDHNDECGCGCGCGHEHGQRYLTLILEDDTELKCPVIAIFEVNDRDYIALLHPIEDTVLLFRLYAHEDGTVDIDEIEDDAEFELVSNTFTSRY